MKTVNSLQVAFMACAFFLADVVPAKASDAFINLPVLIEMAFLLEFTSPEVLSSSSISVNPIDFGGDNLAIYLKDRNAIDSREMKCSDLELTDFSNLIEYNNDYRIFHPAQISDSIVSQTMYTDFPLLGITSFRSSIGVYGSGFDIENVIENAKDPANRGFFTENTIAKLKRITKKRFEFLLGRPLKGIQISVEKISCESGIDIYHVSGD